MSNLVLLNCKYDPNCRRPIVLTHPALAYFNTGSGPFVVCRDAGEFRMVEREGTMSAIFYGGDWNWRKNPHLHDLLDTLKERGVMQLPYEPDRPGFLALRETLK